MIPVAPRIVNDNACVTPVARYLVCWRVSPVAVRIGNDL